MMDRVPDAALPLCFHLPGCSNNGFAVVYGVAPILSQ